MSDTTPTVRIKEKASGRVRIIDGTAFNPELHDLAGAEVSASPKEKGGKKQAAQQAAALSVVEKEGKFVIVNAAGEQQGEESFEKKEDAQLMSDMLTAAAVGK